MQVVQSGAPFVVFGDGTMCKCNPISEADLVRCTANRHLCVGDKIVKMIFKDCCSTVVDPI